MSGIDASAHGAIAGQGAIYPSLAGKRVLISGGGSGIGASLVAGFVHQGARVVFIDIAEADSQALVESLTPGSVHAPRFERGDLNDLDRLKESIAKIEEDFGGIDILINNAGNDDRHSIEQVTPDYWDNRMNVNLRHIFFMSQAVIPIMTRAGGGVILNVGSISWHLGLADLVLYQTAKAGIEGMSRAMARDLGHHNIRVNTIIPGNVQTPRQQRWYSPEDEQGIVDTQCLKARIQPEDLAAMALFLASDDARMCTGHAYWVDAGWR